MLESFAKSLRNEHASTWSQVIEHRFMRDIRSGTLPDEIMARFLIQDYRFLETFLVLVGGAVVLADTHAARLPYGQALGALCGDEDTFFTSAMKTLGIPDSAFDDTPTTEPTEAFCALMREAVDSRVYAAIVAVLCVANGSYLECASKADGRPTNPVHAAWIDLHDNPDMYAFVAFVRGELDRVGPANAAISRDFFSRAIALEKAFLDALY